ncbi:hypothetical protein C1H46_009248 [Malus baccata]|uniref:Uncharacterized protein n=1 Tax=Malus baccata TaxID=106549 RepID=A0A540N221_MALBA|nr:hypothetical protein C1H46_009248 [Malus baccata]
MRKWQRVFASTGNCSECNDTGTWNEKKCSSSCGEAKTKNPIEVSEYSGSELILSYISDPFGFAVKRKSNGQVQNEEGIITELYILGKCLETNK